MISPLAYVDPKAQLGKDVTVNAFAYIDADTVIDDGCVIMPYASVIGGTELGRNVKVYQGAIVGADPQDFRWKGEKTRCRVGDNTVIREHVIINRSIRADGATVVGADCFVFADSHIGHDSHIADSCVIGNSVTIAGDVEIGRGTILSSSAVVHEHSRIGRLVLVKGGTRISGNVPPFVIMAHNPVSYYGVNYVVMQRHAGFAEEQLDNIAKAYRHIYQSSKSLFNALRRIEADIEACPERDEIIDFIRSNGLKIAGGNLETGEE